MPIPHKKLELLTKAFTEKAMSPGEAAKEAGVTYATAKRYYDKWAPEIQQGLESRLVPSIEESIRQFTKKRKANKTGSRPALKRS